MLDYHSSTKQPLSIPLSLLSHPVEGNPERPVNIDLPASDLIHEILHFMQIGEGVAIIVGRDEGEKKEPCKRIYLHAFTGARDEASVKAFKQSMAAHKKAGTMGPSGEECLLYTGHVGISFQSKSPVYGFNPDTGDLPGWLVIERLKEKSSSFEPYPGVVTDDSAVFNMAKARGLNYKILEYVFPESAYNEIYEAFNKSKSNTGLTYSFPGQGGDCNCATWPQEVGLPIPCGRGQMKEYIASFDDNEIREMGECCDK